MLNVKKMRKDLLTTNPTLYCSIKAHLRGKLHMTKLNGGTLYEVTGKDCWSYLGGSYFGGRAKTCVADERRHMFHWTMEDQEKLVAPFIDKYVIEDEPVPMEVSVEAQCQ